MISAKQWYHLFNHQDGAFTAEIQEPGCANFLEVVTDSAAGHAPTTTGNSPGYLDHPNTIMGVWQPLGAPNRRKALDSHFQRCGCKSAPATVASGALDRDKCLPRSSQPA
jgi:hypothetical protein